MRKRSVVCGCNCLKHKGGSHLDSKTHIHASLLHNVLDKRNKSKSIDVRCERKVYVCVCG